MIRELRIKIKTSLGTISSETKSYNSYGNSGILNLLPVDLILIIRNIDGNPGRFLAIFNMIKEISCSIIIINKIIFKIEIISFDIRTDLYKFTIRIFSEKNICLMEIFNIVILNCHCNLGISKRHFIRKFILKCYRLT